MIISIGNLPCIWHACLPRPSPSSRHNTITITITPCHNVWAHHHHVIMSLPGYAVTNNSLIRLRTSLTCKVVYILLCFQSTHFDNPATGVSRVAGGACGPSLAQCSPDASSIHLTVSFHNLSRATGSLHKGALGTCSCACSTFSRPSSGLPMYPPL